MGAEENGFRLGRMETDIKETKDEVKEITKEQGELRKDMSKELGSLRESVILLTSDTKQNLELNKVIKNAAVGFLIVNIFGLVWTFMIRAY